MRNDPCTLALVALAVGGCSAVMPLPDSGSVGDLASGDLSDLATADRVLADLALADQTPGDDGPPSGIPLREGPCPTGLMNSRCFLPPGTDLGFY
jgi:hypothetical protein